MRPCAYLCCLPVNAGPLSCQTAVKQGHMHTQTSLQGVNADTAAHNGLVINSFLVERNMVYC